MQQTRGSAPCQTSYEWNLKYAFWMVKKLFQASLAAYVMMEKSLHKAWNTEKTKSISTD